MDFLKKRKLKQTLEIAKLESELEQTKNYKEQTQALQEYVTEVMEKSRPVREDSDAGAWILAGQGSNMGGDQGKQTYDHYDMLNQAYYYEKQVPHGKAIIRNLVKFVLGVGPIVKPKDSDNELAQEVWDKFKKLNKWRTREKEIVKRTLRDGESFLRWFPNEENGDLKVRFIRANTVKTPTDLRLSDYPEENISMGIGTDPDDIEEVTAYYVCNIDGTLKERIPASEITHLKVNCDSDEKRGTSALLVAMPMIKKYNDWLEDRIVLNKVRSAIALIKTIDADRGTLESIRDTRKSQYQDDDNHKLQAYAKGTVITAAKGVKYEMLSPNINAQDVRDDGRAMLVTVAAGEGLPEMFLTADFSNANYSSSMIAQNPFVREIEDWQDFFTYLYEEAFARSQASAMEFGELPKPKKLDKKGKRGQENQQYYYLDYSDCGEGLDCTLEWPPLITADIEKNNKARETQFRNKILSRETWARKEGLEPETERKNIEAEQDMEIYDDPFELPMTPVNQFAGGEPGAKPKPDDKVKPAEKVKPAAKAKPKTGVNQHS